MKLNNIDIDLNTSPHFLVAGTSGSGKTYFILNKIIPTLLELGYKISIIDSKRDIILAPNKNIEKYNQDTGIFVLEMFNEILRKRHIIFEHCNSKDLDDYNFKCQYKLQRMFLIIDELAFFMNDKELKKQAEPLLKNLAMVGRSAGIHLILATQTPNSKVIITDITHNITNRFCFRTQNEAQARLVLGNSLGDKNKQDLLSRSTTLQLGEYIFSN